MRYGGKFLERGHAAVLLPFDPVRDEVVLIEQIRIAAYDTSETPWLLEMVAGMIEEGESVEDVARREAIEEAGLIVKRTKPVLSFLASPGGTSERSSIMVGEVDATTASGIHGLADENEDIRVHVVSPGTGIPVGRRGENRTTQRRSSLCNGCSCIIKR
ncbi:ADP-ribose pyrophosphatase [Escherichia coli]|uniref:ADP-ribose pyrophosphatase n=1 Tax=Escherichia coli TaxID=562 RepID=A0A484YQR1_ECOLX|nr:ADP-ribose pyrophosphatase [Escherichia coli]